MPIAMQSEESAETPSTPQKQSTESPKRSPSPAHRFLHRLQERKYFDSGDYALCKASAGSPRGSPLTMVGRLHPSPERIPRSNSGASIGNSPMKTHVISSESLLLLDDDVGDAGDAGDGNIDEREEKTVGEMGAEEAVEAVQDEDGAFGDLTREDDEDKQQRGPDRTERKVTSCRGGSHGKGGGLTK